MEVELSMAKVEKDQLIKEESKRWDELSHNGNRYEVVTSYSDYLNTQNVVWQEIHGVAFKLCGEELSGKRILDIGCGLGIASIILAERGAHVVALDISIEMVKRTVKRAEKSGYSDRIVGIVGDLSAISNKYEYFDLIYAGAVLHHCVELIMAIKHISNICKVGGALIAYDPFDSPIFAFARKYLPYTGKHRNENEWPLKQSDYKIIENNFGSIEMVQFGIFTAVERVMNTNNKKYWNML